MHLSLTASFERSMYAEGLTAMQDVVTQFSNITQAQFDFGQRVMCMRMKSLVDIPSYAVNHSDFLTHIGHTQEQWTQFIEHVSYEDALRTLRTHVHFDNAQIAVSK
jgi:hypothetical protein